mgnify:FL=1
MTPGQSVSQTLAFAPTGAASQRGRRVFRQLWFASALLCGLAIFTVLGVRINVTASIPLGLYIQSSEKPARGLIAEFCPEGMSKSQSERYRGFGFGCHDHGIPLLKPIVAVSGDRVQFSPQGIAVNGKLIPNTAPRRADGQGRPLRPWPAGDYTVEPDKIVVASAYHPGSYDSRYLGPIPVADVKLNLRPFLVVPLEYKAPEPKR